PSVADHPVRRLFDRGLTVTINTDDPRISRTTLNREYLRLVESFDFTSDEVRTLLMNAAEAAFAEEEVRSSLKESVGSPPEDEGNGSVN
ncbi:MAG: adenosine deaminase, partial [bacterium]